MPGKHALRKPRRRLFSRGSVAAVAAAAVIFGGGAAWAANATYAMLAGDNLTTSCAGPSLAMHRNSPTSITLKCKTPKPTPTTTASSTPTPSVTPTPTPSVTPTPTPTQTSTGYSCTVSGGGTQNCGPYDTNKITNANGWNTYVSNNCWGDPNCAQTTRANGPDDWQTTAKEPAGSTAVATYPDVAQLFNDWSGSGFNGSGTQTDTPLSGLSSLTSTWSSTSPHNAGTIAELGYDIWLSNNSGRSDEIMVWTDNVNRGTGGATYYGTYTVDGQPWSLYHYGTVNDETIWMPGAKGTFAQQSSGSVDLKALLDQLVTLGLEPASLDIGQLDYGWEVCSTGGVSEAFTMNDYTLTAVAK